MKPWWIIPVLWLLQALLVASDSSHNTATPARPPPPVPSSQSSIASQEVDVIQVVETEIWNGENWIGSEPSRWTTMEGGICVSPADIEAPPNCQWEGDWKIVLGDQRDDYGWSYVYYYMSSERPKRQRIWLRTIVTSSTVTSSTATRPSTSTLQGIRLPSLASLARSPTLQTIRTLPVKAQQLPALCQSVLHALKDDWNFKGFGFSFYKSFIFKRSCGVAFRIPMTTNLNVWDRHPEWPSLSMSLSFFYPLTACLNLSASVNVEWVKHCFFQACILLRHIIALTLLGLARGLVLAGSALAFPLTGQLYQLPESSSLLPPLESTLRQRPTFSTTLQERVGVTYSWRMSAKRGYETRRTLWHLYLPTLLSLLQQAHAIQQACIGKTFVPTTAPKYLANWVPSLNKTQRRPRRTRRRKPTSKDTTLSTTTATTTTTTSATTEGLASKLWAERNVVNWLQRKTGSLGVSTGGPIPDKPHFSCSAVLSLSGFYFQKDTIGSAASTTTVTTSAAATASTTREDDSSATTALAAATAQPQQVATTSSNTLEKDENDLNNNRDNNKNLLANVVKTTSTTASKTPSA